MSTLGPVKGDPDMQHEQIPVCSVAVTLGSDFDLTTQFQCGFATELCVAGGGNVVAVLAGDGGVAQTYFVPSGGFLHGQFVTVKSSANGTTATGIVARR